MAGCRLDRSLLAPALRDGVALHHRTDSAFHALPAFHEGVGAIREALLAAGVPAGPARAVGHAGYELLLDGCLLANAGVVEEFAGVLECAPDGGVAIPPASRDRWRQLLGSMRDERWWLGYRDPELVARGLQRRLQARARLRLTSDRLPAVTAVLSAAQAGVETACDQVVAAVAAALRSRS